MNLDDRIQHRFWDKHTITPKHHFVGNWQFDAEEEDEAILADTVARIAEKNGLSNNNVSCIFPLILRMLKSKSAWSN